MNEGDKFLDAFDAELDRILANYSKPVTDEELPLLQADIDSALDGWFVVGDLNISDRTLSRSEGERIIAIVRRAGDGPHGVAIDVGPGNE